jgi:hypothetical protein
MAGAAARPAAPAMPIFTKSRRVSSSDIRLLLRCGRRRAPTGEGRLVLIEDEAAID